MSEWENENNSKKKVRGLKRRCRNFFKYLTEQTDSLPAPKNDDPSYPSYSVLRLNFDKFFTDSKKTPNSIRKLFIQTVINRTHYLIQMRGESQKEYRIFCTFYLPNLDGAAIIILFTKNGLESFYEGLFHREPEGMQLISLHQDRNIEKELGLIVPKGLGIKGFRAEDDDYINFHSYEIWLIGILE
ncbi:DUF3916 domain-containing protein [Bacillus salipaludis]|nr:DUF3916 domain-containing protein [Bacillus salipaludis]